MGVLASRLWKHVWSPFQVHHAKIFMFGLDGAVWDVGYREHLRPLWRHYFANTQGMIFVVNSAEKSRFPEAREALFAMLKEPDMKEVPVVVIANKIDLAGAASSGEIVSSLGLKDVNDHKWFIQATCAITGEDIFEAMSKMANLMKDFKQIKHSSDIPLWNYVWSSFQGKPARILMLGLDAAGKTTILYKVRLNKVVVTVPTIGFNIETVNIGRDISFTVWDAGGQATLRCIWRRYYQNAQGLLFVVDSSDKLRFPEVREELFEILNNDEMTGVPFVIIANKMDMPGAASCGEIVHSLGLKDVKGHKWFIQATCAITGEGVFEAMSQMANLIKDFKQTKQSHDIQ